MSEFLGQLDDDGQYLPSIKLHSLEKIRRHNYYARMFATSLKNRWSQRAYVGLYSGAGRALVEPTGEIIETTAISVLRLADPFTKYIFVDNDKRCTQALEHRIGRLDFTCDCSVLTGDVANVVPLVRQALPRYDRTRGLISFCFVDPFAADLQFDVIRQLSSYRMDFLILLMLGWDARVNFRRYRDDESSTRISDLIDCPDWRAQWRKSEDKHVVRFLLRKFDEAMVRLGYLPAEDDLYHRVTAVGKGVLQYILVLYTKSDLGQKFWRATLRGSSPQQEFDFGH